MNVPSPTIRNAILGILLAISTIATGEDERQASVRLLEAMEFEAQSDIMAGQMFDTMFQQMVDQGIPKEAITEIGDAARVMMRKSFVDGKIAEKVAALYDENFTEAELEELILFYETPIGRKLLASQTDIATKSATIAMESVQKHLPAFQGQVAAIIEKHQAAEEEE